MTTVRTRVLEGFDDPRFGREQWNRLLMSGRSDSVYLTWEWQRAWWESYRRGELLLILAEQDGHPVALAPFHVQSHMVYFVATEFESDCLDFIGDVSNPEVLDALLSTAIESVDELLGIELYFVPDRSGTAGLLEAAAGRLGLACYEDHDMLLATLDLRGNRELAFAALRKKTMKQEERFFAQSGCIEVRHFRDGTAILEQLPALFEQHIQRYSGTSNPSRLEQPEVRALFERFTRLAADTGWLRFTRIECAGRPIAFHYGWCFQGRYFWGPTAFALDVARYAPGRLLLRHLILAALDEGAAVFDFGTGDQEFKTRLATDIEHVRTWELYPSEKSGGRGARARTGVMPKGLTTDERPAPAQRRGVC